MRTVSLCTVTFVWLCTRDLEPRIILIALVFYSEICGSSLQSQDIEDILAATVDSTWNCYMHIEKKITIKNCSKDIETCFNFPLEMTPSF